MPRGPFKTLNSRYTESLLENCLYVYTGHCVQEGVGEGAGKGRQLERERERERERKRDRRDRLCVQLLYKPKVRIVNV